MENLVRTERRSSHVAGGQQQQYSKNSKNKKQKLPMPLQDDAEVVLGYFFYTLDSGAVRIQNKMCGQFAPASSGNESGKCKNRFRLSVAFDYNLASPPFLKHLGVFKCSHLETFEICRSSPSRIVEVEIFECDAVNYLVSYCDKVVQPHNVVRRDQVEAELANGGFKYTFVAYLCVEVPDVA
ncbi:unnamed protein product [Ceratitis capitata]|uniref:(Mediterranean fruit fly) hypothetical protein n=1 Tax=Ceratitis capitata TaxID=7213 RepID=A0A811U7K2_CERCA|nr:unnamed protein product [Ceratitis capitata]